MPFHIQIGQDVPIRENQLRDIVITWGPIEYLGQPKYHAMASTTTYRTYILHDVGFPVDIQSSSVII